MVNCTAPGAMSSPMDAGNAHSRFPFCRSDNHSNGHRDLTDYKAYRVAACADYRIGWQQTLPLEWALVWAGLGLLVSL
jgi:hypothetical protein